MLPGATRSSTKIAMDIPTRVRTARANRRATNGHIGGRLLGSDSGLLFVEPYLLKAGVAVYALVRDEVLDVRPRRVVVDAPAQDRTGAVDLQPLLDLVDHPPPLHRVEGLRLLLDHPVDLGVAILRIVAGRAAHVVLIKIGVRIVDADAGEVGAEEVLPTREFRIPLRALDLLQRGLDAHLV